MLALGAAEADVLAPTSDNSRSSDGRTGSVYSSIQKAMNYFWTIIGKKLPMRRC